MDGITLPRTQIGITATPPANRALSRLLRLKPSFTLHNGHSARRGELEAYVGEQFERSYGATVSEFMPGLLSMQCERRISAVAGIRPAGRGALFAERYLDLPVERAIGQFTPAPQRSEIVEIGNLAALQRGSTHLFFIVFAGILYEAGFKWAVFTATEQVEAIIGKLNFITHDLAAADPARLGDSASRWGTYYETNPAVRAGDIETTMARLRESPLCAAALALFATTITALARQISTGYR